MPEVFDVMESVLAAKADERMIAFTGFLVRPENSEIEREGVLKISTFQRVNGSGYLTLTFIVDTEGSLSVQEHLTRLFQHIDQNALQPSMGHELEMLFHVPLDPFAKSHAFFIVELHLYFRQVRDQERRLVNEKIIPALSKVAPFSFDPMEWLSAERNPPLTPARHIGTDDSSLKGFLMKWFKTNQPN